MAADSNFAIKIAVTAANKSLREMVFINSLYRPYIGTRHIPIQHRPTV